MPDIKPILRSILRVLLRSGGAFIIAWFVFIVVGATICTQYVLAELAALGADVDLGLRLQVTAADIIGMQPLYGVIFGTGLLIAMVAAWGVEKWGAPQPHIVFTTAGFVAIAVTLLALKSLLEITAIAATRSTSGFLMQCLVGGLAGYVFIRARERLEVLAASLVSSRDV